MLKLSGKTALVTSASRGMGRAAALALAAAGACVLVHYGRGANEADGVVAEIRKSGGRADSVAADLSAPGGPHKLAKMTRDIVGDRLRRDSARCCAPDAQSPPSARARAIPRSSTDQAERHACRHAAPSNRSFSETKSTNVETARGISLRFGKAA